MKLNLDMIDWICEFCYKPACGNLPDGWCLAWQSAVCPDCQLKISGTEGGYHVVKSGAYSYCPDPRNLNRRKIEKAY